MGFLKRYKKGISITLMILSMVFFSIFLLKNIYARINEKQEDITANAVIDGEKEIMLGQKKKTVIISKSDSIKPEINDISNEITRGNYKDGMIIIGIPKIKIRAAVINGTSKKALARGPGLYDKSPLPNESESNVCIAAHRNAYGEWFKNIDKLKKGDEIYLEFNKIKYTYEVLEVFIVEKNDWSVTESTGYNAITLTSCHPLKPPYKRIVARGRLIKKAEIKNNK